MKSIGCALGFLAAGFVMVSAAAAQDDPGKGFMTSQNCREIVQNVTDIERIILGAWVMGYLDSASQNPSSLVRLDNALLLARNLAAACERLPEATLIEVLQMQQKNTPETPGTKANADAFLAQFLRADVDRVALTAALKPTEADIRAVYAQPLADRLVPMYEAMFTPNAAIGPKEGQTELLTWIGTTQSMRRGDPVLEDFPGGYKDVREFMLGNFPIVRFTFAEPGQARGMAYDGLIHVNGRWVLMPRPWRALAN